VPQITASFWGFKLLTTAMDEAASDYLLTAIGLVGVAIGAAGFVVCLWIQLRARRYQPFAYRGVVAMIAVFGTMAAGLLHGQLGVPFAVSALVWGTAVALTFLAWYRIEGTLSIHSITTRRREIFYWLAVSFTFALGTAAEDLTASQLRLGFVGSIMLFAVVIAVPRWGTGDFGSTVSSRSGGPTSPHVPSVRPSPIGSVNPLRHMPSASVTDPLPPRCY
jgi:uncharacterized membrane-anchored protein